VSKAPSKARRSDVKPSLSKSKSPQKTVEDSTIKATFYLTQDTVNGLEDAWLQLRRTAESGQRAAITKSLIVRLALDIALDEIRSKGTSSQLAKRLDQR
jgi:hypothetical protein